MYFEIRWTLLGWFTGITSFRKVGSLNPPNNMTFAGKSLWGLQIHSHLGSQWPAL